jgi:hypothetical protein
MMPSILGWMFIKQRSLDSPRKLVVEAILETKAETILAFIRGLRGLVVRGYRTSDSRCRNHEVLTHLVCPINPSGEMRSQEVKTGAFWYIQNEARL